MNLRSLFLLAAAVSLLPACGTLTDPAALPVPKQQRQFELNDRLSETVVRGLLNIRSEYGFLPGRYAAVHEDAHGTYFRGPTGAVFVLMEGRPEGQYSNGGVWMPHDPIQKPRPYIYQDFINHRPYAAAAERPAPTAAEGAAAGAAAGAVGGAAGGAAAHAGNPGFGKSYGQAAATGAGAGLVAGALIGAIIAADIGKIALWPELESERMVTKLRELAQSAGPTSPATGLAAAPTPAAPALPSSTVAKPVLPPVQVGAEVPQRKTVVQSPASAPTASTTAGMAPVTRKTGPWSYEAANYAARQGCKPDKGAWMVGEHRYDFSRYQVDCGDGRVLVIACDSMACRAEPS